jgi:hypothetical protein
MLWIRLLLLACAASQSFASLSDGLVLRIRLPNGSIEKLLVQDPDQVQLDEALTKFDLQDTSVSSPSGDIVDTSKSIASLGLKHGTLLTVKSNLFKSKLNDSQPSKVNGEITPRWDPFPDLAKDYEKAIRQSKLRSARKGGMTYSALLKIQDELHNVEPQPESTLKRLYMCHISAEKFQSACIRRGNPPIVNNKVGILFGTITRERVNPNAKTRTSLSSTTETDNYCQDAKVHAIWSPPDTKQPNANLVCLHPLREKYPDVMRVATWLGLEPVGWIFTYNDDRHDNENDGLPVLSQDIQTGATLQIENMRASDRQNDAFVTLAMDAKTGASEAFQLSDVCVQMVAQNMFQTPITGRYVTTRHAVLVDGQETNNLDTVLCLVNTALLSHEGLFSGSANNSVTKTGHMVTKTTRKAIKKAIETSNDAALMQTLCDFSLLLALDSILGPKDCELLCSNARKWARGQKRGTLVDDELKKRLLSIVSDV